MSNATYDVVVIGAGPAGENAADYARQRGLTAAIVEKELVGGECSYWGCMPSKALLRPTEVLAAVRRVPAAAAAVTGQVDVAKVFELRDAFTSSWDDTSQVKWLEGVGVDLFRGTGRLVADRTVEVTGDDGTVTTLTAAKAVVIGVGSRAALPPVDGLDKIQTWDNRQIAEAKEVPNRLVVLGGGVIGVEMAQAFKRLGASEVTIIELFDRVLAREEPEASADLAKALERDGIAILVDTKATAVSRDGSDGPVTVTLANGDTVTADELLVATGRQAPTGDLGLEAVGVTPGDGGFIEVDDHLLVPGTEWLYVVGDANARALLTHQGKYQARLVGDRIAGVGTDPAWADDKAVPRVVFTDPQVAAVGQIEQEARDAGLNVRVVTHNTGHVAGGALMGKGFGGTAKLVIDQDKRVIVGATFVGPGVADLLHSATIAIVAEVPIATLWHAVPSFPTVSEVWLRLLEEDRKLELA